VDAWGFVKVRGWWGAPARCRGGGGGGEIWGEDSATYVGARLEDCLPDSSIGGGGGGGGDCPIYVGARLDDRLPGFLVQGAGVKGWGDGYPGVPQGALVGGLQSRGPRLAHRFRQPAPVARSASRGVHTWAFSSSSCRCVPPPFAPLPALPISPTPSHPTLCNKPRVIPVSRLKSPTHNHLLSCDTPLLLPKNLLYPRQPRRWQLAQSAKISLLIQQTPM